MAMCIVTISYTYPTLFLLLLSRFDENSDSSIFAILDRELRGVMLLTPDQY
ncbi:hypothetical protein EDE15_4099 [Edaphobacter aggregans]|uniref:Uncharacterized protein n=1 Tax=Edaphobacter aggregans TaxID=570835 RepID=A0A3R9R5K0_9BACT|nr:hypothetical protein EDE15_4099 [Edaphobacter aggregans]